MKLAILLGIVGTVYCFYCPPYDCKRLDTDTCAMYKNFAVYVNMKGCPDGMYCDLDDIWMKKAVKKHTNMPSKLVKCKDEDDRKLADIEEILEKYQEDNVDKPAEESNDIDVEDSEGVDTGDITEGKEDISNEIENESGSDIGMEETEEEDKPKSKPSEDDEKEEKPKSKPEPKGDDEDKDKSKDNDKPKDKDNSRDKKEDEDMDEGLEEEELDFGPDEESEDDSEDDVIAPITVKVAKAIKECKIEDDIELEQGTHPKVCESSDDCLLKNGKKAECFCGMNSYAYCQPSPFSSIFGKYVSNCENLSNEEMREWAYIHKYYVLIISENVCLQETFPDLKIATPEYEKMIAESKEDSSGCIYYLISTILYLLLIL